ncbi:MAG: hypothetical protein R2712_19220 [Vicinamibacterales bacterium]
MTYAASGLTIVSPTQRYGYVARRAAPPDRRLAYIKDIRREFYPWMAENTVERHHSCATASPPPRSSSSAETGTVKLYHPGQMTGRDRARDQGPRRDRRLGWRRDTKITKITEGTEGTEGTRRARRARRTPRSKELDAIRPLSSTARDTAHAGSEHLCAAHESGDGEVFAVP